MSRCSRPVDGCELLDNADVATPYYGGKPSAGRFSSQLRPEERTMPIVDHSAIPEIHMRPGIRGQFLAHKDLGARGVSLLANTVDPGAAAPLHSHTVEET